MVQLLGQPEPQSSKLFALPAEVRTLIWRFLLAGSEIVYSENVYSKRQTVGRRQFVYTCRLAYQEGFALLWSETILKFDACTPARTLPALENQAPALASSRQFIRGITIALDFMLWPSIDSDLLDTPSTTCLDELRGLQLFPSLEEVMIGFYSVDAWIQLDNMFYGDVVNGGAKFVLTQFSRTRKHAWEKMKC